MPGYDVINDGSVEAGYRELCTKCFHTEVAESDGLDGFEHAELAPVELTDCDGEARLFHFRTRLFGPGVALDAFEVRDEARARSLGVTDRAVGWPVNLFGGLPQWYRT